MNGLGRPIPAWHCCHDPVCRLLLSGQTPRGGVAHYGGGPLMSGLGLDFAHPRPRAPWWAWVLLSMGLAAMLGVAQQYRLAERELKATQNRLERLKAALPSARSQRRDPVQQAELVARAEARRALETPWGELFATLQRIRPDDIAMLGLEADARTGTLILTAEARDYTVMVDFYAQLQSVPLLANISLAQHGVQEDGQATPVRFVLRGRWREPSASGETQRE